MLHDLHAPLSKQRQQLRRQLLEVRDKFFLSPEIYLATSELAQHLADVLSDIKPHCLGGYWPVKSEFNPWLAWPLTKELTNIQRALPWAHRLDRRLTYHVWTGEAPHLFDECGIASSDGPSVEPDVIVVPCLGFTRTGWRLGYGGGYFDRYLAQRSLEGKEVFTIGLAWACCELPAEQFQPELHDRPLHLILTQEGIVKNTPAHFETWVERLGD